MSTLTFRYVAMDKAGARQRGTTAAESEIEAFRRLSASGLMPLKITLSPGSGRRSRRGVSLKEVASFTHQLGVLMDARIPIGDGLRSIAEQEQPGALRDCLMRVASQIEAGQPISSAMAEYTHIFGDVYVQTLQAAEKTGNMSKSLAYLAEMLERDMEARQQVRSALMYPSCIVGVLSLAVTFLIGYVVPKFAVVFRARKVELPFITEALLTLGQSIQNSWYVYVAVVLGVVLGVRAAWRSPRGRVLIDSLLHRIPYINRILIGSAVARFARVFGLCLGSGLNLIDALEVGARASGRPMLMRDAERMVQQVRGGGRLSAVLGACGYLPPFARRMIGSGEEAAELPRMCTIVARQYERETAMLAKNIAVVIEPVLIVVIAGVVLVVALAVFLPMWNMVTLAG